MQVFGGSHIRGDIRRVQQIRNVSGFIRHKYYPLGPNGTSLKEGYPYDIALVKVDKPFDIQYFSGTRIYSMNTVCLPHRNTHRYVPTYATIYGWGRINHRNCPPAPFARILRKGINVPIREINDFLLSTQHFGEDSRPCPVS